MRGRPLEVAWGTQWTSRFGVAARLKNSINKFLKVSRADRHATHCYQASPAGAPANPNKVWARATAAPSVPLLNAQTVSSARYDSLCSAIKTAPARSLHSLQSRTSLQLHSVVSPCPAFIAANKRPNRKCDRRSPARNAAEKRHFQTESSLFFVSPSAARHKKALRDIHARLNGYSVTSSLSRVSLPTFLGQNEILQNRPHHHFQGVARVLVLQALFKQGRLPHLPQFFLAQSTSTLVTILLPHNTGWFVLTPQTLSQFPLAFCR